MSKSIALLAFAIILMVTIVVIGKNADGEKKPQMISIEYKVTDESGIPVPEATVYLWTYVSAFDRASVPGKTSGAGTVTLEAPVTSGCIEVTVHKEGFYSTGGLEVPLRAYLEKSGDKEPEKSFQIILKKKANPIPLFAKNMWPEGGGPIRFPKGGGPFGFDLKRCDWTAPHGNGAVDDIVLYDVTEAQKRGEMKRFKIRFSNPLDGMVEFQIPPGGGRGGSELRSDHFAPETGYKSDIKIDAEKWEKDAGYYFRVRTSVNEKGEMISANYGKIYGRFPSVITYFNPQANDRNVEFDVKRNLLQGVKRREGVSFP